MEPNVGDTDQTLRMALGLLLALIGGVTILGQMDLSPLWGAIMLGLAGVLLLTAFRRRCLLYQPLGLDTTRE